MLGSTAGMTNLCWCPVTNCGHSHTLCWCPVPWPLNVHDVGWWRRCREKLLYKFIESTEDGDFMLALDAVRLLRTTSARERTHMNKHNLNSSSIICTIANNVASVKRRFSSFVSGETHNHMLCCEEDTSWVWPFSSSPFLHRTLWELKREMIASDSWRKQINAGKLDLSSVLTLRPADSLSMTINSFESICHSARQINIQPDWMWNMWASDSTTEKSCTLARVSRSCSAMLQHHGGLLPPVTRW